MSRWTRVIGVVLLASLGATGRTATVATTADRPLTVALSSEPATLNPLVVKSTETRDIVERIYLKLLDEQADFLTFKPRLAESWEYSADSLAITFRLRPGVRWADGQPVTAHDVRFTWELQVDTAVAWTSRNIKLQIRDVEVVDDRTVRFHFDGRYPDQLMDANDGVIVPRHLLAGVPRDQIRNAAIGRAPVGNGPYRLTRWEPGQYLVLERNPDYYQPGQPAVGRVVYKFVSDEMTQVAQLKAGEIDLLESVPASQWSDLAEHYPDVKLYTYPSRDMLYIAWNLERELFAHHEVRRALTMAINRAEIIETLWEGRAVECKSPMHISLWAFDDTIEPIGFDPARAKLILRKHGWRDSDGDGVLDRDGRRFEFEMVTNHSSQQRVDVITMTEAYLRKIGVKVNVQTMEFGAFVEKVMASEFDSCVLGWKTATKPDITNLWHSKAVPPNGFNIAHYRNREVDALIDRARVLLDTRRAGELWAQVQQVIYREQPFTFIAIPHKVNALHVRFCGVEPNAISFFANLREWEVCEEEER